MTISDKELYQSLKNWFPAFSINTSLKRLGGYNNTNYSVTVSGKKYFLKIADQSEKLVESSLQNEVNCMKKAHHLKITPELVFYDPKKLIMVAEFVERSFTFDQINAQNRYIKLLHSLHHSNIQFENTFCPFETIQKYIDLALQREISLPVFLTKKIIPKILKLKREDLLLEKVSCHLDPQADNILDNEGQLLLVDWEFAGMSDPIFDVASMCASEEFSDHQMREILALYLEKTPSSTDWKRLYILRIIADLRMCLFCFLCSSRNVASPQTYIKFTETFLYQIKIRASIL